MSGPGTTIGQLSTEDPDFSQTHTYTLVNDAAGRFLIKGTSLLVKVMLRRIIINPGFLLFIKSKFWFISELFAYKGRTESSSCSEKKKNKFTFQALELPAILCTELILGTLL